MPKAKAAPATAAPHPATPMLPEPTPQLLELRNMVEAIKSHSVFEGIEKLKAVDVAHGGKTHIFEQDRRGGTFANLNFETLKS